MALAANLRLPRGNKENKSGARFDPPRLARSAHRHGAAPVAGLRRGKNRPKSRDFFV
jgi:hypothetical protein